MSLILHTRSNSFLFSGMIIALILSPSLFQRQCKAQTKPLTTAGMAASNAYAQGVSAYNAGDYNEALAKMRTAEAANPGQTDALLFESRALLQLHRPWKAEVAARSYLKTHADSADGHFLLGYVLYRENEPKMSLAEYTVGAQFRKPAADDLAAVALDYVLLHDYTDADKWLTQATQWALGNSLYWYYLGRTKYNENRFQEAVNIFNKCLQQDPGNARVLDNLGLSHQGLGQDDKAISYYRQAIQQQEKNSDRNPQPYLDLGMLLLQRGPAQQAIPYLQKAVELAPSNPKAREQLGRAYESSKDFHDAQIQLQKAVELVPQISALHFELARIYQKENLTEQAKKEFAQCAALNGTKSTDASETPNPDIGK